jgi:gliding motility associated protien GldN
MKNIFVSILKSGIYTCLFSFFVLPTLQAQDTTESGATTRKVPRDGFYDRYLHQEKRTIAYDFIHEKDVFWEKRIWRVIDVREKMNHPFKYEKEPFIKILINHAQKGDIQLYGTMDDGAFTAPLSETECKTIGTTIDTITNFDPDSFNENTTVVVNDLNPDDIKKYRLKEVWFFDEETSTMGVRILGIAPIIQRYDDNGNFLNEGPMFWAYYPELREVLARHEAFNEANDAMRMSWEDMFESRHFASYVTKESNVYDRRIQDYKTGVDALLEADKIKDGMFHFEHDLWEY